MNPTYCNDTACAQFIGLFIITDTLKKKTSEKIKDSTYLSFMTDGDTDVSTKECEIVYAQILHQVQHANTQGMLIIVSGYRMYIFIRKKRAVVE